MEEVNILIIGAGAVGLSIGRVLSKSNSDVVVVEQEDSFGRHTSSRNSEVIHSGIYYPRDTLKARLCVAGVPLIYDYCRNNSIPYSNCGKLVVATSREELPALDRLRENGMGNGVTDLEIIDRDECKRLEPQVNAVSALKVSSTGILDTHKFMAELEKEIEDEDGFVVYDMKAASIERDIRGYTVSFANGEKYRARVLVNSAGLFCHEISSMAGINTADHNLEIHWCKGEYYKTTKIRDISHLIYPLPDPSGISLGIHLTLNLQGNVRFGPSAYYVDEISYRMDETYKDDFLKAVNRYIEIREEWLEMDDCGIRPKLQAPGELFRDFYIREESDKGLPGFINLMGIESPGLTACLAIAEYVNGLLAKI